MAEPRNYREGVASFKVHVDSVFTMIEELIVKNETLTRELEEKTLDWINTTERSRDTQRELMAVKETLTEKDRILGMNDYVMVLIDGDGMNFSEQFIQQGRVGGKQAANQLLQHVTEHTEKLLLGRTFTVIIRVFANVDGLSKALLKSGTISNVNDFREFTVGFTQAKGHINFIDVGAGKEMADSKITGEFRWHINNYNCKLVILGASHDNGYARTLDNIVANESTDNKVMLLEGTPFGHEFAQFPFPRIKFSDIFSTSKLETHFNNNNNTRPDNPWRGGGVGLPATPTSPVPAARVLKQLKASDFQLDQKVVDHLKALSPKPCNDHYLRGHCKRMNCDFSHEHQLSEDDVKVMRFMASSKSCKYGKNCINEKCYWGHECRHVKNGKCTRENCPFDDEQHPPGTVFSGKRPAKA